MQGRQGGWISWQSGGRLLVLALTALSGSCGSVRAQSADQSPPGVGAPLPAPAHRLSKGAASAPVDAEAGQRRLQLQLRRLVKAYPAFLAAIDGNDLVWKDTTRMPIDDGNAGKDWATRLAQPDIEDMFFAPYPWHAPLVAPAEAYDPGRVRYQPLFDTMYGDCTKGETQKHLVDVPWLPGKSRQTLKVTSINGVAGRLEAIGRELAKLPPRFDRYLFPAAGTFNCRAIAGTRRRSAHAHGIAIDIAVRHAHYWRWSKPGRDGRRPWRNAVPREIVEIFERHGFIWGGRWHHYDTMHFEYRPELLPQ